MSIGGVATSCVGVTDAIGSGGGGGGCGASESRGFFANGALAAA